MVGDRAQLPGTVVTFVAALLLLSVPVVDARAPTSMADREGVPVDSDSVLLQVAVQPDGSAIWRVEYRVLLDDENASESFASVSEAVEANATRFTDRFGSGMRGTVSAARRTTGREMSLANLSVHASRTQLPRRYGVLTYTFEWRGFAAVDGETLRVGDALAGLFLDEETTVLFSWPANYRLTSVEPAADERRTRTVGWSGPADFSAGEPRLVLAPSTETPTSERSDGGTSIGPTESAGTDGNSSYRLFAGVTAILAVLVGGAWMLSRRDAEAADGAADLLSTEERVLSVVERHGGRVKQKEVTEELGWTAARTSQVVADLREDGTVEVFRVGRENVVALPEELDT